jgi:hypothetical protein
MVEMMNALGFITPTDAETLRDKTAEQESELIILRDQNERLRNSLSSLLGGVNNSISGDDAIFVQSDGQTGNTASDRSDSSTADEQPSNELVSEQGSAGISDNSSSDQSDFII